MAGEIERRSSLGFLGAAYVSLSAWMFLQERAMRASGGPGIVGFELAGTAERAEEIVTTWGEEGRAAARRSLLVDYGVLATYAPLMAFACRRAGERLGRRGNRGLASLGPALASAQLVASACDFTENTALLGVLAGRRGSLPALARASAVTKFSLLGAGAAYVAVSMRPGR